MDVIIWAIILGAVFYINKKSKSAGSKNTQPNKPRPQQKRCSRYGTACRIQFSRV